MLLGHARGEIFQATATPGGRRSPSELRFVTDFANRPAEKNELIRVRQGAVAMEF